MRIAISGPPGVGKTTLALKVVEAVKAHGSAVGGFVTLEVREKGARIGFDVLSLKDGRRVQLARIGEGEPRVGKYVVDLGACGFMKSLLDAEGVDLLVVDEIGPMEAKCPSFLDAARSALFGAPRGLAVVHLRFLDMARRWGLDIFMLSKENRDRAVHEVLAKLGFRNI